MHRYVQTPAEVVLCPWFFLLLFLVLEAIADLFHVVDDRLLDALFLVKTVHPILLEYFVRDAFDRHALHITNVIRCDLFSL